MVQGSITDPQEIERDMEKVQIVTFADIIRALKTHPEWIEELRKIILTVELLELPRKFEIFLEEEFRPLKKEVESISRRVDRIEEDVETLKEDVRVLKEDVRVLKEDVRVLKEDVRVLKEDMEKLKGRVGDLFGELFEIKVRDNVGAFFGKILRRARLVDSGELADKLYEAVERGYIKEVEADDALKVDALISGSMRKNGDKPVLLAVEISMVGDVKDAKRAINRALTIGKAYNMECIPVVVAKKFTIGAKKYMERNEVLLV